MTSVYVIEAQGGPVKIGIAKNPQGRLRELGTGTPFRLRLAHVEHPGELGAAKVERAAHALLASARTHGEWFAVTVERAKEAIRFAIEGKLQLPDLSTWHVSTKPIYVVSNQKCTPRQMTMARELLGWSKVRLSIEAGLCVSVVSGFETGRSKPHGTCHVAMSNALEAAGVEFIPENGGGAGVRLRKGDREEGQR